MRQFFIAAFAVLFLSTVIANDQLQHILDNAKSIDDAGIDDGLWRKDDGDKNDVVTTTMKTITTTTTTTMTTIMTTTTTNDKKTETLKNLARAVKKAAEVMEESGLSAADISGICVGLTTLIVTLIMACAKMIAHVRNGGGIQDFFAEVAHRLLIRVAQQPRRNQAIEAPQPPGDHVVGHLETEV